MITQLTLQSFRSYAFSHHDLFNLNVIIGKNGSGKTSLLEAISMLHYTSGFLGAELSQMNRNLQETFLLGYTFNKNDNETQIGIENRNGSKKTTIDGEEIKTADLTRYVGFKVLYMIPQDEFIFSSGTSEKRNFFDRITTFFVPDHQTYLSEYKKQTSERMKVLYFNQKSHDSWLNAIELRLSELCGIIASNRISVLSKVSPFLQNTKIQYHGEAETLLAAGTSSTECEKVMLAKFKNSREGDKTSGRTNVGVGKTTFDVTVLHKSIVCEIASSGEQKMALFDISASCLEYLSSKNSLGIFLIDEVISKVDSGNRAKIFDRLSKLNAQIFMTGTEQEHFDSLQDAHFINL